MEIRRNFSWEKADTHYIIRNVPYHSTEHQEDSMDALVALKITTLKGLMEENEVPHDVDYETVKDVTF